MGGVYSRGGCGKRKIVELRLAGWPPGDYDFRHKVRSHICGRADGTVHQKRADKSHEKQESSSFGSGSFRSLSGLRGVRAGPDEQDHSQLHLGRRRRQVRERPRHGAGAIQYFRSAEDSAGCVTPGDAGYRAGPTIAAHRMASIPAQRRSADSPRSPSTTIRTPSGSSSAIASMPTSASR